MSAPRLQRPGLWPGRSNVIAPRGMVCTSQPLASAAALDVLRHGGNAIDAAIAATVALGVVEPLSTGFGGDMFALYWSAKDKKVKALNGSGACPENLSWRTFARKGVTVIPQFGWPSVSVPGCVDGLWSLHQADGKMAWNELFPAAIEYARNGVPLSEIAVAEMGNIAPRLQNDEARRVYLPNGKPPEYGKLFKQPEYARTLELVAAGGADAFYRGEIAAKIVKSSETSGGFFNTADFSTHTSLWQEPLKTTFRGVDIFEMPPNSQGLTAIIALNILASLDLEKLQGDWVALSHALIEAIKLSFAERSEHLADPVNAAPIEQLLSLTFATHIGMTIDMARAIPRPTSLIGPATGDTVSVCTADSEGNVVSVMSSLFQGSGIVAGDTGIHLHNRASLFTLEPGHANLMGPKKRPFHTLMPGLGLRYGAPYLAFGVTGGHHQPQGQVQFLLNFLLHEMTLQESVSAPRLDYRTENFVALESDFPGEVREALAAKGHKIVENDSGPFGGVQALRVLDGGILEGASDPRKDGCAMGY